MTADLQNIPGELKACPQWVVWTYESRNGADKPDSGTRSERSLGFAMWLSQYFRAQPAGEEIEVSKVKAAALGSAIVTEKQWERFSPKYLEKRNIMGTWYCRPLEKVE